MSDQITDEVLKTLTAEVSSATDLLKKSREDFNTQVTEMKSAFDNRKATDTETAQKVLEQSKVLADIVAKAQALEAGLDSVKREMDQPVFKSGKEGDDADRKNAIELQRRIYLSVNGNDDGFVVKNDELVSASAYRSVMQKMVRAGVESKERIVASFTDAEKKAYVQASMDSAFFSPEMLGIEMDCNIECADLTDLYSTVNVSRSQFMYPQIKDYAAIGSYECDASCDAPLGEPGNVTMRNGATKTFRGMFCFQKKELAEANIDLLSFMIRGAVRSERINKNRVAISGNGESEPEGWLTSNCFKQRTAPADAIADGKLALLVRQFLASAPMEYGAVNPVMHQNMFAYLMATPDANGRFLFGDGMLVLDANDTPIRVNNCLPDATADLTVAPAAGSFIMAAANWKNAYYMAEKSPLRFELFVGGSSMFCSKWQFESEHGAFTGCCEAGRILKVA
jgi:hypothetical protein